MIGRNLKVRYCRVANREINFEGLDEPPASNILRTNAYERQRPEAICCLGKRWQGRGMAAGRPPEGTPLREQSRRATYRASMWLANSRGAQTFSGLLSRLIPPGFMEENPVVLEKMRNLRGDGRERGLGSSTIARPFRGSTALLAARLGDTRSLCERSFRLTSIAERWSFLLIDGLKHQRGVAK
jgi:hypothetical protein